ncbi:MAG: class I SAM-dependent methyltransferase [Leptospirales bacterium]|nr:class I SAM-dependent methyltransferase [Leptospirales bacterium]
MNKFCPLCASPKADYISDNLFKCLKCGAVFNTAPLPLLYNDDYFTADYLKQYGRTYEEDFPQIYGAAQNRLERIKRISPQSRQKNILDIGCALGFFLKAASDNGFARTDGIEISAYAASYCREKFGFNVRNKAFEKITSIGKYDVITAWYFIEHCSEPFKTIEKISASLEKNGVFAFSAPSVFGPMFCFHKNEWAASRPSDHVVDFNPKSARKALKRAGFRKVKIYAAGFHPERIMRDNSFLFRIFSGVYKLFTRLTGYSDTIEVYAVK